MCETDTHECISQGNPDLPTFPVHTEESFGQGIQVSSKILKVSLPKIYYMQVNNFYIGSTTSSGRNQAKLHSLFSVERNNRPDCGLSSM